jgi:predicted sulfurtransferase
VKNNARSEKSDQLSEDVHAIAALEQEDISEEVILLDVRNEYETKIGSFQLRDELGNVISAATDPRTRQVRALDLLFLLESVIFNIIWFAPAV